MRDRFRAYSLIRHLREFELESFARTDVESRLERESTSPTFPGESSSESRRRPPNGVSEAGQFFSFLPIWRASAGTFRTFVTIPTAQYLDLFETLGIMILVTIVPLMLVRWFVLCTQSPMRWRGEETKHTTRGYAPPPGHSLPNAEPCGFITNAGMLNPREHGELSGRLAAGKR